MLFLANLVAGTKENQQHKMVGNRFTSVSALGNEAL